MPDIATYRRTPSPELLSAIAHHEAGHALAVVSAFRDATWLPFQPPRWPVRSIEITEEAPGQSGFCVAPDIYSAEWDVACIAPPFRPLMEAQVVIELAGGVAEAVYCGERRAREVLPFAEAHCGVHHDLTRAKAVLGDLFRLTGVRHYPQNFAAQTLALLLDHWNAVEALASALVTDRRIDGHRVEQIIDAER